MTLLQWMIDDDRDRNYYHDPGDASVSEPSSSHAWQLEDAIPERNWTRMMLMSRMVAQIKLKQDRVGIDRHVVILTMFRLSLHKEISHDGSYWNHDSFEQMSEQDHKTTEAGRSATVWKGREISCESVIARFNTFQTPTGTVSGVGSEGNQMSRFTSWASSLQ